MTLREKLLMKLPQLEEVSQFQHKSLIDVIMDVVNEETNNIWQPIETVPLDTPFLVTNVNERRYHVTQTYWSSETRQSGLTHPYQCSASHWMPLPTPPTKQEES